MKFQVGDIVRRVGCNNSGYRSDGKTIWTLAEGVECVVVSVAHGWEISVLADGVPLYETHDCRYFELVRRPQTDPVPDVRNTDPDTSKVAAKAIKPKKLSIKASILDLLDKYPLGLTGTQIAEHTGYRLNSVTPRFAELSRVWDKQRGARSALIADSGVRIDGQIVWVLA